MNEPRLTASPPDEQQLIALIENKPPDELTIGEIEALRAALPHSPELQRVLSRHIQMDQYLADALGRLSVSVDEILARAAAVNRRQRRGLPIGLAFGLLFLLAGLGGFLIVIGFTKWNRPAEIAAVEKPAANEVTTEEATKKAENKTEPEVAAASAKTPQEATKPEQQKESSSETPATVVATSEKDETKPAVKTEPFVAVATEKPAAPVAKPDATSTADKTPAITAAKPETAPVQAVSVSIPPVEPEPPVVEYVRPAGPWDAADQLGGAVLKVSDVAFPGEPKVVDPAQLESIRKWLEAVPGANYQFTVDPTQATLQGVARIKAPWDDQAMMRLELGMLTGTKIHLWHGNVGVSIYAKQPAPDMTWAAAATTRNATEATPATYTLTSTDNGRAWRTGDNGPAGPTRIDIRYENGQVIVARGDVALLSAPLPGPPQEVYLEGRTLLRDLRMLRSEPLPAEPVLARTVELSFDKPITAKWQTELTTARFLPTDNGSVRLTSSEATAVQRAGISIPQRGIREVIFEVSDFTSGAGVFVGDEQGVPFAQARFFRDQTSKTGQLALGYPALADQTYETALDFNSSLHGYAAGRTYIRLLASGGRLRYWISADGEHWAQLGQPQRLATHDIRSVGILCGPFKQPCGITLDRVLVRSFRALDELAPLEMLEQAPTIVADQLPLWLERVLETQPAELNVNADQWRAACAVRSLSAGMPMPLAGQLSKLLLQDALANAGDAESRWRALQVMAMVCDTWSKGEGALDWLQFEAEAQKFGTAQLASGNPMAFRNLLTPLVQLPVWTADVPKLPLAELAREELLGLVATQQWPEIRRTTKVLTTYGYLGNPQQNLQLAATNNWANASAVEHGAEEPVDEDASVLDARWRHPLSIELSKEGFNVLAELEVALANRAFKDACQIVTTTRGAGAFGLLPSGKDPRLWSSFPLAVSDTMRRFPKMQETMREQYGAVGLLRVKQSMVEADDQSLEMATVQFFGTPAAALAHFWLGDRYLAAGDFVRAIRHYVQAEPDAEVALRSQILAHRRLASALAGEAWGTAVTQSVQMGEAQMPADRFEALVAEVLKRGQAANATAATPNDPALASAKRIRTPFDLMPAPAPTTYNAVAKGKLEQLAGSPPGGAQQSAQTAGVDWVARNFSGIVEKDILYFSDGAQATAWNLPAGNQTWRTAIAGPGGSAQQLGMFPIRPVLVDGLLVMRRRIQQGYGIIALRADTGALAWQAEGQLDAALQYPGISDPVAWSDEILSLVTEPLGKHALISLIAHDSTTGALRRKRSVGVFSQAWLQYQACSITLHRDSVIASIGGSVLCLDPEGEVRWIRRQQWISPDIALNFGARDVLPPAIHGEQMYIASEGTQGLECLDVSSGKLLWKQPLCNAQRTIGVAKDILVVETGAGLVGFDNNSGEMRWQLNDAARLDGVCTIGPGGLVYTRKVAAREPNQFHPQLVWVDPATGNEKARAILWQLQDPNPGFGPIFRTESQTFALFGRGAQQLVREVFELTPDAASAPLKATVDIGTTPLSHWTTDVSPRLLEAVQSVLPGWTILNGDSGPLAGLVAEHQGRKNVLALKTASNQPTRLAQLVNVPENGKTTLELDFAAQPNGATILLVRVGDTTLWRKKVTGAETGGAWQQTQVDLSPFAGLAVWVQLQQIPTGQANEEAFVSRAEVKSTP